MTQVKRLYPKGDLSVNEEFISDFPLDLVAKKHTKINPG